MSDVLKQAIQDSKAVKALCEQRAKDMLVKEFHPAIKKMLGQTLGIEPDRKMEYPFFGDKDG